MLTEGGLRRRFWRRTALGGAYFVIYGGLPWTGGRPGAVIGVMVLTVGLLALEAALSGREERSFAAAHPAPASTGRMPAPDGSGGSRTD
ncbi:hypothetical protein AB1399_06830 [Hydrogenibacillus schlegelii]|uniref:Uncharacterized protein n=1 Tax=Hydrogenibacillus schlegelii TaxID=1484 RepID=A0A132NCF5_HYDSH|nr:hypothetical protein [Hydrogenibacillus schlegelii]KWX07666.1 hypothetical protein TR75_02410 [Hydrogenibacillus schlegelii]OAR05587.1 hypothetical protein SA87_12015 [Hydrogenibacillus schlegelii]PTQ53657.1 MAG: hypothetical protein HSCHL_1586 [Hydrogenibacillus schlegelii]